MDFHLSEKGPNQIHIALFKNLKSKDCLFETLKVYQNNVAFINPKLSVSIMHVLIAIRRALHNYNFAQMKTPSMGNEVVYYMSPTGNVSLSLLKFMEDCKIAERVWPREHRNFSVGGDNI